MKQGRGNGNNLSWEFRIWVGWVLFVNCISRTPQLYFIFWEEKEIIFRGNWSWDGGSSAAEWFSPEFWEKPSGRGRSDRPTISFAPFLFVFIFVFVFGRSDRPTISFAPFCICIYIGVCIWEQWQAHNFFCTILYFHNGPCVFSNLSTMPKFVVRNECAKWRSYEYFLPRNLLRCQCWVFCAFLCLPKLDLFPLKLNCLNIHSFWLGRLMCSLCDCLW